ncbi:MAG: hypothetical protein AAGC81_01920 [Pseudomonadota bacterium]
MIALPLILMAPAAFSAQDPEYDIAKNCADTYSDSVTLEQFCLDVEVDARDKWRALDLPPSIKNICLAKAEQASMPYQFLNDCAAARMNL